jgi:hypothetical protein
MGEDRSRDIDRGNKKFVVGKCRRDVLGILNVG